MARTRRGIDHRRRSYKLRGAGIRTGGLIRALRHLLCTLDQHIDVSELPPRERFPVLPWRSIGRKAMKGRLDRSYGKAGLLREMQDGQALEDGGIIATVSIDSWGHGEQPNTFVVTDRRRADACTPRDLTNGYVVSQFWGLTSVP